MMRSERTNLLALGFGLLGLATPASLRGESGFDTPVGPATAITLMGLDREGGAAPRDVRWLRIRGMHVEPLDFSPTGDEATRKKIAAVREHLAQLRAAGYRLACMLRWGRADWTATRESPATGGRAPLDLREAFVMGRKLAETYGDVVDVWEVENEPDIVLFADSGDVMSAYFKALALGISAGRVNPVAASENALHSTRESAAYDLAAANVFRGPKLLNPRSRAPGPAAPRGVGFIGDDWTSRVVMPALCLPPGPYLEQLLDNGMLSYTEGFNFHYYGFAEDYEGVYDQFRHAVTTRRPQEALPRGWLTQGATRNQRWPTFSTEWGYAMLDGYAAQTAEGRVRQWRFFRAVAKVVERRQVSAPMAFLLHPYYEHGMKEFGLAMPAAERNLAYYGFEVKEAVGLTEGHDLSAPANPAEPTFEASGRVFRPQDFGADAPEPWMHRIGERVGGKGDRASPALAWLLDDAARREARHGERGRDRLPGKWSVRTEPPSPVVFDFIAGADTVGVKSYQGHWLTGPLVEVPDSPDSRRSFGSRRMRTGSGTLVVDNFGPVAATLTLPWTAEMVPANGPEHTEGSALAADVSPAAWKLELAPGERREIPVTVRARADGFLPSPVRLAAAVRTGAGRAGQTITRWANRFYALPQDYEERQRRDFDFSAEASEPNRMRLLARPHATEEPPLQRDGRWLVSDGLRVEETSTGWRLHVDHFPGLAMRPAVAELPLPKGWLMPTGTVFTYDYRILAPDGAAELAADAPDPQFRRQTGVAGTIAEAYFRTANGNLFSTVPRLNPTAEWKRYNQSAETFTMMFLGRSQLPWSFAQNEPVALVFFIRPSALPAVFEVRAPHLAEYRLAVPASADAGEGAASAEGAREGSR